MTIVGTIIVIAVGGLALDAGSFAISGMGLAGIIGVLLNLILPEHIKTHQTVNHSSIP
jgi:uracil permease